jgi:alkanesulfonate monooxygenase SsuD/methylene tetrahydromethanopterin reductase-like flavin-dependent oxidoreductase (luciferase family)
MKVGLFAINMGPCSDPLTALRVAQAAEAAGFESVWTGEHIVLPDPDRRCRPRPCRAASATNRGAASLSTSTRKARFSIRPSRSRSSRRTPSA